MSVYAESYKEYRRMSGTFKGCVKIRHDATLLKCYDPGELWLSRLATFRRSEIIKKCYDASRFVTLEISKAQQQSRGSHVR